MPSLRELLPTPIALAVLSMAGCGGNTPMPMPPGGPSPSPTPITASAYILPNAVSLNDRAFGDEPIVIHQGERLRWVNVDAVTHVIVADSPDATDFRKTDELHGGGEQSFVMVRAGTTGIHCAIHPNMTGTLTVRN